MKQDAKVMAYLFDRTGTIPHAQGFVNRAQAEMNKYLSRKDHLYELWISNEDDDGNCFGLIYYEIERPYNVFEW